MGIGGSLDRISTYFIGSLVLGIAGAVTVLVFAPKAKPHGAPAADPKPQPTLPTPKPVESESLDSSTGA